MAWFKRSQIIDDLVLPLAVAGLTTTWLHMWAVWLVRAPVAGRTAEAVPSPWLMAAVVLASAFTTRWALSGDRPMRRARRIVLAASAAGLTLMLWLTYGARFPLGFARGLVDWGNFVSPEFVVLTAGAYLWWRGILVGRARVPYEDLESAFYGGMLALAVLFGVNTLYPLLSPVEAIWPVLGFFAAGLSALALASFERSRRQQKLATGAWLDLNRYWLMTVAGVVGLILLGALIITGVFTPQTLAWLWELARPVVDFLAPYLLLAAAAIVFVVVWLATPVILLLIRVLQTVLTAIRLPQLPEPATADETAQQALEAFLNSPVVQTTSRGLTIVLILGVFALLFLAALRRFRLLADGDLDETRESLFTRELIAQQLRDLLRRLRGARPASPSPPYLDLAGAAGDPRLIARRAYQAMLEWARSTGQPRAPGQTPHLYADALGQAAPEAAEAIRHLTNVYVRARYAAEAPSPEEARRAEDAAAQLRALAPKVPVSPESS